MRYNRPLEGDERGAESMGAETGEEHAMPIVDWDELRRCVGDDDARVRDVTAEMLDECPRVLAELRAGLAAGDAKSVGLTAHRLKGSARHFGARSAMAAAATIESLADAGDLAGAAAALPELEDVVTRLAAALTKGNGKADRECDEG